MPVAPDYLADYRALGCAPGCSAAELERAWRLAMSHGHPDRVQPERRAEAIRQTQGVNAAYRRLRAFAQQHGRLPGTGVAMTTEAPAMPFWEPGQAESDLPPPRGRRRALAAAAVLGVLGASWLLHAPPDKEPGRGARRASTTASTAVAVDVAAALALQSPAESLMARVGTPPLRRDDGRGGEVWEYGPSSVTLRAGRIVDWYSSPLRPLPFSSERPPTADPLTAPPSRR